ncbi:MAG: imidazolonepropionase [Alphaproteobacteria bacterium]|nr:imidazolonepropionase [Alphaproteobacteria bacterium]
MTKWDHLWINARLATMREGAGAYGAIENAALADKGGRIAFAGPMRDLPGQPDALATRVIDAKNQWITPGLIDCHTHLVFAGNRAAEFEQRRNGVSYEAIAKAGGGIMSTVRATRAADEEALLDQARPRFNALLSEGVTTVEIKSGYGLDLETELRLLRVARRLGEESYARISATYLGLHALPPEGAGKRSAYVAEMSGGVLQAIANEGLADAVDAFCEGIAFTPRETEHFFAAAKHAGLKVKLHADQLSDTNGAALAAKFGAISADHLEHTNDTGIAAMAKAGTVAVLLPGAFFTLRETKKPPVEALRRARVPIAVATDCNPGTSPVVSLITTMQMACTLFGLTAEEALAGTTRNAARALGLDTETGTLEVGKAADYAVWPLDHPCELSYWIGSLNPSAIGRSAALAAANQTAS